MKKNKILPDAWKQLKESYEDAKKTLLKKEHEEAVKMNFEFSLGSRILGVVECCSICDFEGIIKSNGFRIDEDATDIAAMVDEKVHRQICLVDEKFGNISRFIERSVGGTDFNGFSKEDAEMIKKKLRSIPVDMKEEELTAMQKNRSRSLTLIRVRSSEIGIKCLGSYNTRLNDVEEAAGKMNLSICSYEDVLQILINLERMPLDCMIFPAKQGKFGGYLMIHKHPFGQRPERLCFIDGECLGCDEDLIFIRKSL